MADGDYRNVFYPSGSRFKVDPWAFDRLTAADNEHYLRILESVTYDVYPLAPKEMLISSDITNRSKRPRKSWLICDVRISANLASGEM